MDDTDILREKIKRLEYASPGQLGFRLADVFNAMIPLLQSNKHTDASKCPHGWPIGMSCSECFNPTQNRGDDKSLVEDGVIPLRHRSRYVYKIVEFAQSLQYALYGMRAHKQM